jgi:hypothetical protein
MRRAKIRARRFGESETTEQGDKDGVVDMHDANMKHLIWRGSAEDAIGQGRKKRKEPGQGCGEDVQGFPSGLGKALSDLHANGRSNETLKGD